MLAAAGAIGFIGNEIAAYIRLRAGRRLNSAALVADAYHARTDGLVSFGVILSALVVSIGLNIADPLIGLAITLVILRIPGTPGRGSAQVSRVDSMNAAWQGRMIQAAGKYGEHAPMAAACCNACRTCATTNGLALAGAAGVTRFAKRLARRD